MTEPRPRRRAHRPTPRNFYRGALAAAEQEEIAAAARATGLDDEVALLRLLVRRELRDHPDDLRLALQGVTLLIRAVTARYRLAPADQEALEQRVVDAIHALTASIEESNGTVSGA